MLSKNCLKHLMLGALVLIASNAAGQASVLGNSGGPGDYLGWDPNQAFPLEIRHNANEQIEWYTDATRRMVMRETELNGTTLFYNSLDLSGHLGIGGNLDKPLTYLHLRFGPTTDPRGHRPWMKTGLLSQDSANTSNYLGIRHYENEPVTSLLNWSRQLGLGFTQFSFNFTTIPGGAGLAGTLNGLEIARMTPDDNGNEGYFGIGDFQTAGVQPISRVDVLNGDVRIRDMMITQASTSNEFVTVDLATGILEHRPLPDDCEWTMSGGANNNNLWTATGTSTTCPNAENRVGIGWSAPQAKLHVYREVSSGNENMSGFFHIRGDNANSIIAGRFTAEGSDGDSYGIQGRSYNAPNVNFGLHGRGYVQEGITTSDNHGVYGQGQVESGASAVTRNYGVKADASAVGATGRNYGVYSVASGAGAGTSYGIWATASGASTANWAGWFQGNTHIQGNLTVSGTYPGSDAMLKTNIAEIDNALELLGQLQPKRYDFLVDQYPQLSLPAGQHMGLIAQEVELILPGIVREFNMPAELDDDGNVLAEEFAYKGVNYTEIIPILIAAVQEQQTELETQQATNDALNDQVGELMDRMDQLEQLLALCCQNPIDSDQRNLLDEGNGLLNNPANDRNLRIQPNPFNEQTTIYYNLERSGRMQLLVNSSDGKQLRVLEEAQMEAGEYQYAWYTADMSAGLYYVTLLLDGEPVVKKAVKVN